PPVGTRWRRWTFGALEACCYVGATLLMLRPASGDLATVQIGSLDGETWMWHGWRIAEEMRRGTIVPWRIPDVVAPYGIDLRLEDGWIPSYICALWNLVFDPILAFNLAVVTGTLLNMWSARALARVFTEHRGVLVLCAIAFASAP